MLIAKFSPTKVFNYMLLTTHWLPELQNTLSCAGKIVIEMFATSCIDEN